jgi:hypothetical protein
MITHGTIVQSLPTNYPYFQERRDALLLVVTRLELSDGGMVLLFCQRLNNSYWYRVTLSGLKQLFLLTS